MKQQCANRVGTKIVNEIIKRMKYSNLKLTVLIYNIFMFSRMHTHTHIPSNVRKSYINWLIANAFSLSIAIFTFLFAVAVLLVVLLCVDMFIFHINAIAVREHLMPLNFSSSCVCQRKIYFKLKHTHTHTQQMLWRTTFITFYVSCSLLDY